MLGTRFALPCAIALLSSASVAAAQNPPSTAVQGPAWELGGYGGLLSTVRASGTAIPPPAGAPILTSSPVFPSREVSSWFVGDGAVLLNDVLEEFALAPRLTPLDHAMEAIGLDRSSGAAFGAFLRRRLTRRVAAELRVNLLPEASGLPGAITESIEASRATFAAAFGALFATGPFTDVSIAAVADIADGSPRSVAYTGALLLEFGTRASFAPYVAGGGGVITGAGTPALATLAGQYRATLPAGGPIDESDLVTLRYTTRTAPVGVLGAGVRLALTDRWGLQIDGRVLIGPSTTRVTLDATPAVHSGSPADFIESLTYPSVQFSNAASTGRRLSLSGPSLQRANFFTGDGIETRVLVTAGLSVRF